MAAALSGGIAKWRARGGDQPAAAGGGGWRSNGGGAREKQLYRRVGVTAREAPYGVYQHAIQAAARLGEIWLA